MPLVISLGPKLFFVHMMSIPTTSSKIIGRRIVLSSCKQLKLQRLRAKKVEWQPLVTQTWNYIGGDSLCMENNFACEQLKVIRNKFDVNRIGLNS